MIKAIFLKKIKRYFYSSFRFINKKNTNKIILINSIPKSGTYLLHQILNSISFLNDYGLFVASRFQHYPKGGGFLAPHKDEFAIKAAKQLGINLYYNFLLIMTKKGKDYKKGGGFVLKNNKIITYEDVAEVGDVIIYNSKTTHGVLDIDSNLFPSRETKEGRYIALTTLFKW